MLENLPTFEPKRLAIKLKPAGEKAVKQGHPWVFDESIRKQSRAGQAGDLAVIFDQRRNSFLAVGLWDPFSPIRIKVLQVHKSATINKQWFESKIDAAYEKRLPLLATDTNSYRFVYGENDGLPGLIADVYADVLVVKLYSFIWLPYIKTIFPILLQKSGCEKLVLRLSRKLQNAPHLLYGLSDGQVLTGRLASEEVHFKEHGVTFAANVIHGHKTGFFLDHRHNRKRIGELAKGKTVLDVFAYAGGFSVHALVGGATQVTSLDISAQALEAAKNNVALNIENARHEIIKADAFESLLTMKNQGRTFDIIVVDPPSFAKKGGEVEKALVNYARLAALAIALVNPGGILLMASCSSRVSRDVFFQAIEAQFSESGRHFELLERHDHDIDHPVSFPEGAYLKCGYYQIF